MAIDFPNSPTTGDLHTVNGKQWQWDSEKWIAYGVSLAPDVLKVDSGNNRVGINQTSPAYSLDVTGTARITGDLTVQGTTTTIESAAVNTSLVFEGATVDDYETTLTLVDPTADRTITLPNNTGTVALTSDLSTYATLASPTLTGTPAAPTAAADTNTTQIATTAYVQTELGAVSSDSIADADSDTKIQVEEGSDEDIIRFDTAGTERMTINADGTFSFAQGLEDSNVVLASQVFR